VDSQLALRPGEARRWPLERTTADGRVECSGWSSGAGLPLDGRGYPRWALAGRIGSTARIGWGDGRWAMDGWAKRLSKRNVTILRPTGWCFGVWAKPCLKRVGTSGCSPHISRFSLSSVQRPASSVQRPASRAHRIINVLSLGQYHSRCGASRVPSSLEDLAMAVLAKW